MAEADVISSDALSGATGYTLNNRLDIAGASETLRRLASCVLAQADQYSPDTYGHATGNTKQSTRKDTRWCSQGNALCCNAGDDIIRGVCKRAPY